MEDQRQLTNPPQTAAWVALIFLMRVALLGILIGILVVILHIRDDNKSFFAYEEGLLSYTGCKLASVDDNTTAFCFDSIPAQDRVCHQITQCVEVGGLKKGEGSSPFNNTTPHCITTRHVENTPCSSSCLRGEGGVCFGGKCIGECVSQCTQLTWNKTLQVNLSFVNPVEEALVNGTLFYDVLCVRDRVWHVLGGSGDEVRMPHFCNFSPQPGFNLSSDALTSLSQITGLLRNDTLQQSAFSSKDLAMSLIKEDFVQKQCLNSTALCLGSNFPVYIYTIVC